MNTAVTIILTTILLFWQFGAIHSTTVSQCSDVSFPDSVEIENCAEQPCIVHINSTTAMTMKFKAPRILKHIAPRAVADVNGISIIYPLDQNDACDGIVNTSCPLEEGQEVEYTFDMLFLPIFPPISLTLEFSLIDEDRNDGAFECFKVSLQLTKI